jgi:MFS family permease
VTGSGAKAGGAAPKFAGEAAREWRRGWPVVLAGVFGFALLTLGNATMGAFMAPVTSDLGFNRSQFSAGLSAYALVGIVMGPLVGILIDKLGVRAVAISGALLVGVTYSLFATSTGAMSYWLALWLLYAAANQLIMTTVWWAAVARVFTVSRGLATSVTILGTSVAVFFAPVVANVLIEQRGWRAAFVILGLSSGLAVALVCWIALKRSGPPQAASGPAEAAQSVTAASGMSWSQAVRSMTFIKFAIASFIAYGVRLAITIHVIPILSAGGVARDLAVWIGGSYGLWMAVGQTVSGAALDRFSGRWVSALCLFVQMTSLALLMLPPHPIAVPILAVCLFGLSMGGLAPTYPYLTSRYFGLRSFGRLFGILASLSAVGYALGPLLAAHVYDVSGSYALFLAASIPALLLSAVLILSLGPYPDFAEEA